VIGGVDPSTFQGKPNPFAPGSDEFIPYYNQAPGGKPDLNISNPATMQGLKFEDAPNLALKGRELLFSTTLGGWDDNKKTIRLFTDDPQFTFRWGFVQTRNCPSPTECLTIGSAFDGEEDGLAIFFGNGAWTDSEIADAFASLDSIEATPEPATVLLWSTTMAGLGLARWRHRRNQQL